jgi:general secretion pathway protein G
MGGRIETGRAMPGKRERGVSYIEMVATITILLVLAAAIAPMAKVAIQRRREMELRKALREIRQAIDVFHLFCNPQGQTPPYQGAQPNLKISCNTPTFYPAKIDQLVEPIRYQGGAGALEIRFRAMRRIPMDPMTGKSEWGLRARADEPGSTSSSGGGADVWDVFTKYDGKALDGSRYQEW